MHFKGSNTWGEEWTVDSNKDFFSLTGPVKKEQEAEWALGRNKIMVGYTMAFCLEERNTGAAILSHTQNMGGLSRVLVAQ